MTETGERNTVPARIGRARPQRRLSLFAAVLFIMLTAAVAVTISPAASLVHQLALMDHIGELCLIAISKALSPIHRVFEFAVAGGLLLATVDRCRAWKEARLLLSSIHTCNPDPGSPLSDACFEAGLQPSRVLRVSDSPVPALTIGALRPVVLVNDKLDEVLSREELVAVLAHEGEHVRRRDPLRLSLMRWVTKTLFWLPAVRALEVRLAEETELRADRAAARISGIATASALLALVRNFGRVGIPALSTGLSQHEFIALRIRLLAGHNASFFSRVSHSSIVLSFVVLLLLWTAALAELHEDTHSQHVADDIHVCSVEGGSTSRDPLCRARVESEQVPRFPASLTR